MSDADVEVTTEPKEGERRREPEEFEGEEREAREAWFFRSRVDDKGEIPQDLYLRASQSRRNIERRQRNDLVAARRRRLGTEPPTPPGGPGTVNWTPLGPSAVARGQAFGRPTVSGRVTSIEVGPNGSRVYAGAGNGGVWRSLDSGLTWKPLDDYEVTPPPYTSSLDADSLSVGTIAVKFGGDPAGANDTIFVGTGEPVGGFIGFRGIGVLTSTGGGAWTREATNLANQAIFKLVADPDVANQIMAASTSGLFNRNSSMPNASWTNVAVPGSSGSCCDLVVGGSAATGNKTWYAAFWGDKVYKSSTGTGSWTALTGLPAAPGRIALAAAESDGTLLYALTQNGALYRLVGTTFQLVANTPPGSALVTSQGSYDLVVAIDPSNTNVVYLAGSLVWSGVDWDLALYRGTITGASPAFDFGFNAANASNPAADATWVGRGVHADGHAIAFALDAMGIAHVGSNVWVGSDGGLWNSTSSGAIGTYNARNTGFAITQTTYLAQDPDTDAVVFTGSQDNGTVRYRGEQAWFESPEGDGGGVAIDPNDPYRIMRQYVRAGRWVPATGPNALMFFSAGLYLATDGGQGDSSWNGLNFPPLPAGPTAAQKQFGNQEDAATNFYAPIAASPKGTVPTLAAFGTNRLWLTNDWDTTWVTLPTGTNPYTTAATSGAPLAQDQIDGSAVDAIAFVSATRILAATFGTIWRYDFAGPNWFNWSRTVISTAGLPAGHFITGIAPDPASADRFYVCLGRSGYVHVWYYDGAAWQSAGPPAATLDVPCHAIAADPSVPTDVYLGSDVGVWKGQKTGTTTWNWTLFSQGLPEAAVLDLGVHDRARLLRASTHGRGVWEIQLGPPTPVDPDLYLRVNFADTGRLPGGARYPWVENADDPTRSAAKAWHWMSADIKVRRPSLPNPDPLNAPPDYVDFAVNIDDYVDTSDVETAETTGDNRVFVQVHNRGLTPVQGSQVKVWLLLTDAAAGLPALPTNYAAHMAAGHAATNNSLAGDPPSGWLAGSAWVAAETAAPFKAPPGTIDVRTPGVVEFTVNVASVLPSLPAWHDHICAAAFVTTPADPLTATDPSLDNLTMHDKHVAHRNLHLVVGAAKPSPRPEGGYTHGPQTILVDLWQTAKHRREVEPVELVVSRGDFTGHLSLVLTELDHADELELHGFRLEEHDALDEVLRSHLARWLERADEWVEELGERIEQFAQRAEDEYLPRDEYELRVRRLTGLDRRRVYVAGDEPESAMSGIRIPYGERVTAAINVQAPADARPGDRFRFDVLQRMDGTVVGGSTYVLAAGRVDRSGVDYEAEATLEREREGKT
jgi:hypothetical protein